MTTSATHLRPVEKLVRFGFHGSRRIAERIIETAGYDPAHGFELAEYELIDPFRLLRDGEIDVMIVKFDIAEPDLEVSPVLAFDPRAAILSAHHPLALRTNLSIEELADYPSFHRPGSMPVEVWDRVVPRTTPGGRQIRRVHHVDSIPEMLGVVVSSDAVHISLASLADLVPNSVRVIPIHDLPPAPVRLAWRRNMDAQHVRNFLATVAPVPS
ncbi:LysR substrate-binding domain-containing protein [Nocardia iowensis]|uniref:LysR substrate-binding domain-containing protein n=1 Tax=Nocardia iowensis TaxID=204891 RepID=A0ABX8RJ77_NOCIO|nr:LysR substrate-binding domain-containing protein [Nocardia iowensis]QXN89396.1 hypothetical protein KV110_28270 [Nocardia iowensis]